MEKCAWFLRAKLHAMVLCRISHDQLAIVEDYIDLQEMATDEEWQEMQKFYDEFADNFRFYLTSEVQAIENIFRAVSLLIKLPENEVPEELLPLYKNLNEELSEK